jgi:Holliday junction resolvasome RuvABC endonuclease subunit
MTTEPVRRLSMGIDYSTLALHVAYGPGPEPFRLKLPLAHLDPEDRAMEVFDWLTKLISRIEEQYPDLEFTLMSIEKPWLGLNAGTLITLTQVQTACIIACQLHKWFAVSEDSNKIRKKILGVGSVPEKGGIKKLAQQWVRDTHQLETDFDTADSIVIWHYATWLTNNAVLSVG